MKSLASAALITVGFGMWGSASAMPISNLNDQVPSASIDQVRLVCDRYGRCFQSRPRYRVAQPYGPRYYAPAYRPHTYGYGPGYYGGGPSVGFSFGVGPRW